MGKLRLKRPVTCIRPYSQGLPPLAPKLSVTLPTCCLFPLVSSVTPSQECKAFSISYFWTFLPVVCAFAHSFSKRGAPSVLCSERPSKQGEVCLVQARHKNFWEDSWTQKAGQSRGGHQPWGLGATRQVRATCFSPSCASSSARKISFLPAGLSFRGLGKDLKGYMGDDSEPTASTSCLGREPQLSLDNSMTQQPPKTGTERAMQPIGRRNCSKSNET